jgi:hypothetical protein
MMRFPTRAEAGDELREQAASCRRLALKARTTSGSEALSTVARQFDADATRIDLDLLDGVKNGDAAALVRVREALERQTVRWLRPQMPPSA